MNKPYLELVGYESVVMLLDDTNVTAEALLSSVMGVCCGDVIGPIDMISYNDK